MSGELPKGWTRKRLGDHFTPINRRNVAGVRRVLTASGGQGLIDQEEFFNKRVASADLSNYLHIKRGEFAYNRSAMSGYPVGAVKRLDRYDEGVVSSLYLCFAIKEGAEVDSDYAAQTLDSTILEDELRPLVKVGARAHGLLNVATSDFMSVWFPTPPLPEQKKIAAILAAVDEAIQTTQRVLDQMRRMKEGLLQDLLTRGLPGHRRFKQTEIGEIPESWEIRRLTEVVEPDRPVTYGIVQTGPDIVGGVPCVRVVDLVRGVVDVSKMIRTTSEISDSYRRTVLRPGDIMMALRGEIGHVRLVDSNLAGANLTRGVALVAPAAGYDSRFMLWALRSPGTRGDILRRVNGSALQEIPLGSLRQICVPVPPKAEQIRIAQRLDSTEVAEERAIEELTTLHHLKSGLLQDLLTGKVRVTP